MLMFRCYDASVDTLLLIFRTRQAHQPYTPRHVQRSRHACRRRNTTVRQHVIACLALPYCRHCHAAMLLLRRHTHAAADTTSRTLALICRCCCFDAICCQPLRCCHCCCHCHAAAAIRYAPSLRYCFILILRFLYFAPCCRFRLRRARMFMSC